MERARSAVADGIEALERENARLRERLAELEADADVALGHLAQRAGGAATFSYAFATGASRWSPAMCEMFGLPDHQTPPPADWLLLIHPDDRAAAQEVLNRAARAGIDIDHQFRRLRADGSVRWLHTRGRVLRAADGSPGQLVGATIDVTDLVQMQLELQTHGERLQLAMAAGRLASWEWDVASGRLTWSGPMLELLGLATRGHGGHIEDFWSLVLAEDRPRLELAMTAALAGHADYAERFRMRHADGRISWVESRAKVLRDHRREPVRVIGIDRDVTAEQHEIEARRRAEAALLLMLLARQP